MGCTFKYSGSMAEVADYISSHLWEEWGMTADNLYVFLSDFKHSIRKPTFGSIVVLMCSPHYWVCKHSTYSRQNTSPPLGPSFRSSSSMTSSILIRSRMSECVQHNERPIKPEFDWHNYVTQPDYQESLHLMPLLCEGITLGSPIPQILHISHWYYTSSKRCQLCGMTNFSWIISVITTHSVV